MALFTNIYLTLFLLFAQLAVLLKSAQMKGDLEIKSQYFLISGSGGPKYKVLCGNQWPHLRLLVHIGFYLMAVLGRWAVSPSGRVNFALSTLWILWYIPRTFVTVPKVFGRGVSVVVIMINKIYQYFFVPAFNLLLAWTRKCLLFCIRFVLPVMVSRWYRKSVNYFIFVGMVYFTSVL